MFPNVSIDLVVIYRTVLPTKLDAIAGVKRVALSPYIALTVCFPKFIIFYGNEVFTAVDVRGA
jgi:hypothetical protein